jgi:acyl-CoA synthetase (AMP-forming)/AMP-acid ligase II
MTDRAPLNVGHTTDNALDSVPDRTALVVDGDEYSYRQLEALTRRVTAALAANGVGPGDRVALVNLGSALSVATIFGAARLGATTAQMNAYLTPGELGQLAELVGARIGVAGPRYVGSLRSVIEGPVLEEAELAAFDPDDPVGTSEVGGVDDTALVLFTSGTTGLPKPIDPNADQVVDMMSAPIFHIGGTLGLLISLHQGKKLVLLPKFDAGTWLSLVEEHGVTQTFVVPTMLRRILDHPQFATTDLSSLRALSYGAAAAPVELIRQAVAAFPDVAFSNTFGQTETLGAYAALTPDDHRRGDRLGSVGRPLAGVEVRIVDPVTKVPVDQGEVGELAVKADQNTTTEWLYTGDTGWQDDEGYLYATGRLSDVINRGGEKFGPVEVEEVLRAHPGVADVGVVGMPDTDLGERVGAVVVATGSVAPEDLVAFCADHLATYKVPEYLAFASELPITALGKLDRKALRVLLTDARPVARSAS